MTQYRFTARYSGTGSFYAQCDSDDKAEDLADNYTEDYIEELLDSDPWPEIEVSEIERYNEQTGEWETVW